MNDNDFLTELFPGSEEVSEKDQHLSEQMGTVNPYDNAYRYLLKEAKEVSEELGQEFDPSSLTVEELNMLLSAAQEELDNMTKQGDYAEDQEDWSELSEYLQANEGGTMDINDALVEAYTKTAILVKEAADEEGIDLDAIAEDMDDDELAEFLDAAFEELDAQGEFSDLADAVEDDYYDDFEKEAAEKAKWYERLNAHIGRHPKKYMLGAGALGALLAGLGAYLAQRSRSRR